MSKIWLVFKHEFATTVLRRSFLITLFLLPSISFALVLGLSALQKDNKIEPIEELFIPSSKPVPEGYIDPGGLLRTLPPWQKEQLLRPYPDEAAAEAALLRGEITSYYIIPADYQQEGLLINVRPDYNPLTGAIQSQNLRDAITFNLLQGDRLRAERYLHPLELERVYLNPQPQRERDDLMTFMLPYAVMLLFYFVILESSSLMLNDITAEKQNRVLEVLLTSITPLQMLAGKIVSLGLVGLLQTVVWSGSGYLLLGLSGQAFALPEAFQLPVSILAWGVVFFILGYALYASLMAGAGALVPNMREGAQISTLLLIPMFIPILLISVLVQQPNGALAVTLSLFPLTAPVTMMTRLAAGPVPFWQPLLAAVLLLVTALLAIRAVAGMFRAQYLLSGQPFKMGLFFKALIGKA